MGAVLRILVVDDDPVAVQLARAAARSAFPMAEVDAAASAEEGVAALRRRDYDAILADMHMSRATGIDLLEIAERERPRAVRVLVTGEGTPTLAHEALRRARIHAFVPKGGAPSPVTRTRTARGRSRSAISSRSMPVARDM
ncbi:MAG TPA: response regulator, partial [Candidatus Thermoplasmatota archaeon]|nr:response regulator [Candidatus Thermoplasmatota archaeon]